MTWLSGWSKRQAITLTGGADGSQVDFQLKLSIAYDSDMLSDFSDLRFTDADGATLIDAWLEDKTDSTSADVWVEFPSTPADGVEQTYYMYYDKSDAVSDWDIGATFLFGDDFSGDLSKWTLSDWYGSGGSGSIESGKLKITSKASNKYVARGNTQYSTGIIEGYVEVDPDTGYNWGGGGFGNDQDNMITSQIIYTSEKQRRCEWNIGGAGYQSAGATGVSWTHAYFKVIVTGTTAKFYIKENIGDSWITLKDDLSFNLTTYPFVAGYDDKASGDGIAYFDDVRVRKYTANPPTYGFGSEENAPSGLSILDFERAGMRGVMRGIMRGVA